MSPPKKIAYFLSLFPVVRETFIAREIIELERNGFDVTIVSLRSGAQDVGAEEMPQCRVIYFPFLMSLSAIIDAKLAFWSRPLVCTRAIFSITAKLLPRPLQAAKFLFVVPKVLSLMRTLDAEGIGHIHAHWATVPATCAYFLNRISGVRFSISAHAWDIFADGNELLLAEKIRAADRVFVCTRHGKNRLAEFGGDDDKVKLAYHGIDLPRYNFTDDKPDGPVVMAAGGSLLPQKGLDVLMDALGRLETDVAWEMVIFGNGPELQRLQRLAGEQAIAERVHFVGAMPHKRVIELMQRASIFVMPSRRAPGGFTDGLPNVVGEAMACGAAVVGTSYSGIPEMVDHNENGLLVEPGDAGQLAGAIASLLAEPERRLKLARAARERVEGSFDVRENIKPLVAYFEHATGTGKSS